MSLGRLLVTGQSLVGGQDAPSRYRMNKQLRLPKFVSPRNPFGTEAKAEPAPPGPVTPSQNRPAPKATAIHSIREKLSKLAAHFAHPAPAVRRFGELLGKNNPFSRVVKSARVKKSPIPSFTKPPVQSELSLDKVQVVRNDLSDADLEVVPLTRARAPDESKSELAAADQCETTENVWGRLTTRLFSSTQT